MRKESDPGACVSARKGRSAGFRKSAVVLLLALVASIAGCTDSNPIQETSYLVRVGDNTISVLEYEKALELAKAAYPHNAFQDRNAERAIRIRVLRELTEELILRQRARELGISVTETEMKEAENRIRSDYPDGLFEETLLESAVSYIDWKNRLRARLLLQKLIENDLKSHIRISTKDVADYYYEHRSELTRGKENQDPSSSESIDERIVEDLYRSKAEAMYPDWIESLRQQYLIDINIVQWRRIAES